MNRVLDTSAAIELLGRDVEDLPTGNFYAPELIDIEFVSAVRKRMLRGTVDEATATLSMTQWAASSVIRCPHWFLMPRIWQLRGAITPYDASYVALAEHLEIPLLTADRRLAASAAPYCEVMLVG